MIERSAGRPDSSGDFPLPIVRKRFTVEGPQQIEIDGRCIQLDVLHDENRPTGRKRHLPQQSRTRRTHVHIRQDVIEILRIPLAPDVELHLAAARCRERRIDPRDIRQRYRVTDDVHIVANGKIAPPHDTAVSSSR